MMGVAPSGLKSARIKPNPHGLWRSLAARLTGGQEVAGSNPASPTNVCTAVNAGPAGVRQAPASLSLDREDWSSSQPIRFGS